MVAHAVSCVVSVGLTSCNSISIWKKTLASSGAAVICGETPLVIEKLRGLYSLQLTHLTFKGYWVQQQQLVLFFYFVPVLCLFLGSLPFSIKLSGFLKFCITVFLFFLYCAVCVEKTTKMTLRDMSLYH